MKRLYPAALAVLALCMMVSCAARTAQPNTAEHAATDVASEQNQGNEMAQPEAQRSFQWPEENIIEVRSDEDIARIEAVFDPLLEAAAGNLVRAPIHAVVFVDSLDALKAAVSRFESFGDEVTTFEFRFTAPVDNSEEEIHLHQVEGVPARLILAGVGDQPVNIPLLRFDLQADAVQIHNLSWNGGSLPMSYVHAKVSQYFEMKDVTASNNRYDSKEEPDASPMFDIEPSEGAKLLVRFENVRFEHNEVHSLTYISRRNADVEVQKKNVTFQENVCFPGSCASIGE